MVMYRSNSDHNVVCGDIWFCIKRNVTNVGPFLVTFRSLLTSSEFLIFVNILLAALQCLAFVYVQRIAMTTLCSSQSVVAWFLCSEKKWTNILPVITSLNTACVRWQVTLRSSVMGFQSIESYTHLYLFTFYGRAIYSANYFDRCCYSSGSVEQLVYLDFHDVETGERRRAGAGLVVAKYSICRLQTVT